MIHNDVPNINKGLCKLKAPLKIKIFLWYLCRGVVLTNDNLVKHNCYGSKQCCFCDKDETIKHLFFECRFARAVWSVIQAASGLSQPHSVSSMLGSWLYGLSKELKSLALLGAAATCLSLWLCRNDLVFEKKCIFSFTSYLLDYTLAPYMGCPTDVNFTRFGCSGISTIGVGGQVVFYLGT
jgi:hypothetical protein